MVPSSRGARAVSAWLLPKCWPRTALASVNCVLPSIIDTEANRAAMGSADAGRWVTPASLAEVILFLASDAAKDVRGALVPVYGQL